jgi:Xaa-Pro dipeptidase
LSSSVAYSSPLDELRHRIDIPELEVLYISRPVSIAYLTGFQAEPHERLMCLVVRPDEATLIVPSLEEQKARAHVSEIEVLAWRDGEDPYRLVRTALNGATRVGIEADYVTMRAMQNLAKWGGRLVPIELAIHRMRLTKREDEIEKLARAAAITDTVLAKALPGVKAGQSELEVALLLGSAIAELGATPSFETLVQSGPNSAMPHLKPSARRIAPGDFVLLDFGAAVDGYKADITRMSVIGEPSYRHREIHELVLQAHDAAIEAARPGVTTGAVDAAARRVIEAAGYGEHFFHRVGHGLGLEAHEDPSLDPGSETVLEPGMVFTVEPGVYIHGWGGVRIEDDVVVEEGGCRVLTTSDRTLRVIR